jgi:hypothetical protein
MRTKDIFFHVSFIDAESSIAIHFYVGKNDTVKNPTITLPEAIL